MNQLHLTLFLICLIFSSLLFNLFIEKLQINSSNSSKNVAFFPSINQQGKKQLLRIKPTSNINFSSKITAKDASQAVLGKIQQKNKSTKKSNPTSLGWIPYWNQGPAFDSFQSQVDLFDYLGVFWYVLRSDGTIQKYPNAHEDTAIVNFARSNNVKVLAVVANLPAEDEGGDWDYKRVDKVISSSAVRNKHINDLVNLAISKNFDGINIDYESLRSHQKNSFSLFIKELAYALHAKGKVLGVSLHPKVGENDPDYSNGSQGQDWKELAKYADHLYIMTYDEHWDTSPPGPIASVPWVKEVLAYAQTLIPSYKLFAGVPLDGYDWGGGDKAAGLTFSQASSLINKYNSNIKWNSSAGSHYFSYITNGKNHTVWYEDNASFSAKLSLFNDIGLKNLAFWPLGGEDSRIWNTLRSLP